MLQKHQVLRFPDTIVCEGWGDCVLPAAVMEFLLPVETECGVTPSGAYGKKVLGMCVCVCVYPLQ